MKNIYNDIKIMKNIIKKLDEVVTGVLNHNEIIFLKGVLNSYISELESKITITMTIDEIQEEIEEEIDMADFADKDTCSSVSVELLKNVLCILYQIQENKENTV